MILMDEAQNPAEELGGQGSQDFGALTAPGQGKNERKVDTPPANENQQQQPGQETPAPGGAPQKFRTAHTQKDPNGPAVSGEQVPATPPGEQVPATPPGQQVVSPAAPDLKAIVEAVVGGMAKVQPAPGTVQPARQLTPAEEEAEFNKRYGIVTITPEHMAAILDQDPKKAAATLQSIIHQNQQATLRMGMDLLKAEVTRLRGEYDPHIKSWQDHQKQVYAEQATTRFYTEHKDLAGEKELVDEISDAIQGRVLSKQIPGFKTEKEFFQAVATAARATLQRVRGTQGNTPVQRNGQQQPPPRQMSSASSSGRSGTGPSAPKTDADIVFGPDAR